MVFILFRLVKYISGLPKSEEYAQRATMDL